jgi:hypothetical protein
MPGAPAHLLPDHHPAAGSARATLPASVLSDLKAPVGGGLRLTLGLVAEEEGGECDGDASRRPGEQSELCEGEGRDGKELDSGSVSRAWTCHRRDLGGFGERCRPLMAAVTKTSRMPPPSAHARPPPPFPKKTAWTFLCWATVHPEQPRQASEAAPPPPPALIDGRVLTCAASAPPLTAALGKNARLRLLSATPLPPRLPTAASVRLAPTPTRLHPAGLRAALVGRLVEPGAAIVVGGKAVLTVESVRSGSGSGSGPARVGRRTALLQAGDPEPAGVGVEPPSVTRNGSGGGGGGGRQRRRRP